jgi:hypothetical protein
VKKRKKKINIINVERTSIDSPLPIYKVDVDINISVTKPKPKPSNYLREVVHNDKKGLSIYYFEILENLLIPMNIGFIVSDYFSMPYGIGDKAYIVYKKLELKKYINSNSFDSQLVDIIKKFQDNENLPSITLKNSVLKRHGKLELYSPREVEIYLP